MFDPLRLRPGADVTSAPVAFGKLRALGDFVRTSGYVETCRHFEAFVERSLAWATDRHGKAWAPAFAHGGIVAFVYQPPQATGDASLLVGVMAPSHDAVGRRYPLVIAVRAPLEPFTRAPQVLPLVFADFFDAASQRLASALRSTSAAELEACVRQLGPVPLGGAGEALASYHAWAQATALHDVWAALFPAERAAALPRVAIQMLLASAEPLRGRERPMINLGLRLPLGDAAATAVAFWVDLVRQVARWQRTVPSVFWCPDDSIVLQLGDELPSSLLGDCWVEGAESDQLFSLEQAHSARSLATLSTSLESLLATDTTSAWALLAAFGP